MKSSTIRFNTTQKLTLLATILASSLVFIDSTALNVALPALQKDLGITGTELLWVVNGYALFLSALLLVGGSLGDLYGRNKIFLIGLGVFSISSLLCGISQNSIQLITARCLQGIGGALLTPGSLAILSSQFGTESRGKAIGLWSTFSALTGIFGPVLGGWLAEMGLWRVIFFLNIPFTIVVFLLMLLKIPESNNPKAKKLDVWGAIFVTLGLAGLTFGFIESPNYGFSHPLIIISLFLGCLSLIVFLFVEIKSRHPMIPLALFKSPIFSAANILTLFIYAALGGAMFFIPLNLIQVQGYSEVYAGLAMLPIMVSIALISPSMGKFVDKHGCRLPLMLGPLIAGIGFFIMATIGITIGIDAYWRTFCIAFVLLGIGLGITVAPLTTAVMGAVSTNNSGIASGVNNTIARAAGVLAIALLGALVLFSFKTYVNRGMENMNLSIPIQKEILMEAAELTAAHAPVDLPQKKELAVNQLFKKAFVYSFNRVMYITAFLMFIGGLTAFFSIRNNKITKEEQK